MYRNIEKIKNKKSVHCFFFSFVFVYFWQVVKLQFTTSLFWWKMDAAVECEQTGFACVPTCWFVREWTRKKKKISVHYTLGTFSFVDDGSIVVDGKRMTVNKRNGANQNTEMKNMPWTKSTEAPTSHELKIFSYANLLLFFFLL